VFFNPEKAEARRGAAIKITADALIFILGIEKIKVMSCVDCDEEDYVEEDPVCQQHKDDGDE
jgi:hypothetical protein